MTPGALLSPLFFGTLVFDLEFVTPLRYHGFAGSLFHGAFGNALHQLCCKERRAVCAECPELTGCAYGALVETPVTEAIRGLRGIDRGPHPYVLRVAAPEASLEAGDGATVSLVLIGKALSFVPNCLQAMRWMSENGLAHGQGRFRVVRYGAQDKYGRFQPLQDVLKDADASAIPVIDSRAIAALPLAGPRIRIEFITPMRLPGAPADSSAPSCSELVTALGRRLALLCRVHCGGELLADYSQLAAAASVATIVSSQLTWSGNRRYSHRQERGMKLNGFTGTVTYDNLSPGVIEFLRAGRFVHAGKWTTFGFGRFNVVPG